MARPFTELDMTRVRTRLLLKHPFFGSLAMQLKYVPDSGIKTLCTNGVELRYNPDFLSRLSDTERQGCVVHEIAHCAFLHVFRCGNRNMRTWNQACDFAINPMIESAGLTLPREIKDDSGTVIFSGPCIDPKYAGMSAEAIYAKLRAEEQKKAEEKKNENTSGETSSGSGESAASGQGSDSGPTNGSEPSEQERSDGKDNGTGATGPGDSRGTGSDSVTGEFIPGKADAEGGLPGDMNEQGWQIVTEQALSVARMAGTLPGGWSEEIKAQNTPVMDPWAVIEQFVVREIQSDFSWTNPNKRLISRHLYLPGMKKENVGEMVIAIDTSGSASSKMLTEWASHVVGIAQTYLPERVHVVFCDTRVNTVNTYEPGDYGDIEFNCKGRGGTKFQPVFDWVEEQGIEPVVLIYFTDTYGPCPKEPSYPVLWAVPEYLAKNKGPFGETVHIGVE